MKQYSRTDDVKIFITGKLPTVLYDIPLDTHKLCSDSWKKYHTIYLHVVIIIKKMLKKHTHRNIKQK